MTFGETLKGLRKKAGKSRYQLARFCGVTEPYLLRLERGERTNPSREVVIMLGLALVEGSKSVDMFDIDSLMLAAGYAPLRRRGQAEVPPAATAD